MKRGFPALAVATVIATFAQIALGGLVRNSGSGLGCRDQWPLCNGEPYPGWNVHAIIEYSHRTFGALTSVLLLATFVAALLLFRRSNRALVLSSGAALVVVAFEIPLGALVVFQNLAAFLVVAHFAVAMGILACTLVTAVLALAELGGQASSSMTRWLMLGIAVLALVTFLSGSAVVASGADDACHSWPLCQGGFNFDFSGANAFTMVHRGSAGVLLLLAVIAAARSWLGMRDAGFWPEAVLASVLIQAAIGVGAAIYGSTVLFDTLHVAMAAAVWGVSLAALVAVLLPRGRPAVAAA